MSFVWVCCRQSPSFTCKICRGYKHLIGATLPKARKALFFCFFSTPLTKLRALVAGRAGTCLKGHSVQNIVPHFALCPSCGDKYATLLKSRQLGIHLSNFTTAPNVISPPQALGWSHDDDGWAALWGNCGSIACSVHDPSPLPPLWLFSMAYTCLLFIFVFFCFLFYRVSGWVEREAGLGGRAFWRRAGVKTTRNKARTRGSACFAMCLRCASQENINTRDSSTEILLPLSFSFPLTFLTA